LSWVISTPQYPSRCVVNAFTILDRLDDFDVLGYRNQFGGPKYDNKKDGGDYRERSSPHRRKEISHSIRQREWHLVGMIPLLGHVIGNVVNRDHPVGEDQDDEDEDSECEIAQKVHGG